jgi:hypothetical protein
VKAFQANQPVVASLHCAMVDMMLKVDGEREK